MVHVRRWVDKGDLQLGSELEGEVAQALAVLAHSCCEENTPSSSFCTTSSRKNNGATNGCFLSTSMSDTETSGYHQGPWHCDVAYEW